MDRGKAKMTTTDIATESSPRVSSSGIAGGKGLHLQPSSQILTKFTKRSPSNEICSQSMTSSIFLSQLKPATPERNTIRFRIVRMWQDYIFNDKQKQGEDRKSGIGYILADAKGNFAYAKLSTPNEEQFKHKLIEQEIYDMSIFNVHPCKKGFNPTKTDHMIRIEKCTQLRPIKGKFPSIPTKKPFEFVNFNHVATMSSNESLIDVVGFVSSVSPVIDMGTKKVRYVNLQDDNGATLKLSIWDEQIELFNENKVQDECLLVVTAVSLSKYNGEMTISSKPSTMFYYDLDIPEVNTLKESGVSVKTKYVENEKAEYVDWQDYRRSTLGEMIEQYNGTMEKGVSNTCDCTITKFWKKWYYLACEQCFCGVNKNNKDKNNKEKNNKGLQYCKNCQQPTKSFQAYNADVEIADETHSYEATVFTTVLENYFQVDVHDLENSVADGCDLDPMFRQKLEKRKGTFQISMKTYKGKMSLSVVKFEPSAHNVEQDCEDDDALIGEGSPKNQGLIEYSNINDLEKVTTPSKGETSLVKKRKILRKSLDEETQDNSEEDGTVDGLNDQVHNGNGITNKKHKAPTSSHDEETTDDPDEDVSNSEDDD